ncbi:MAG: carbohydrate ABC transporter permease [Anaerolineae bacterium]|nr:carbohydrate ABC transporter permease [Anaerolineae bacterium]
MALSTLSAPASSQQKQFPLKTALLWLLLLPIVLVLAAPVWYMFAKAFTPEINQMKFPIVWLPDPFTLQNFSTIFFDRALPVGRWMFNSAIVTIVGTFLVLFVSSLSAYAFARLEFPGRDVIFAVLIISMLIPGILQLIPVFLLMRDLKLLDTYIALWLPGAAGAGTIFFLRQQFFALPRELEDAAVVDGASRFRVFWQVALPLVRSALVATGILTALAFWNELFWALIMLSSRENITLPVGLLVLRQSGYIQRGLAFAGGFIATAPPLVLYAFFQRQIIAGMATAGLAGR